MILRPVAEFSTDLPHDQIEDGPHIIQFAGKSVAGAVGEMLTGFGCTVSEPVCLHERGWELDIVLGKQRLGCRISLVENFLVQLFQTSWFAMNFGQGRQQYVDLLKRLGVALAEDPRFHDVQWFAPEDVLSGKPGATSPVTD